MNRTGRIEQIYGIVVGAAAAALGIALICMAADIYYSGVKTGVMYTREIVSEKLMMLSVPFIILIGAIVCGAVFPLSRARAKHGSDRALKLLAPKQPSGGDGEEYSVAKIKHDKFARVRHIVRWCALGITLACTVASLCYLLDAAHFPNKDITREMLEMTRNVLPWIAAMFTVLVGAAIADGVLAARQLTELKKLIKSGNGKPIGDVTPQAVKSIRAFFASDVTVWAVRGIVFAVAVAFIIAGAINGGANDVLVKAINICTECIGLG